MAFKNRDGNAQIQTNRQNCLSSLEESCVPRSIWSLGAALMLITFVCGSHAQPVIIQNPESKAVTSGKHVSISVAAEGKRLRYRWQFNGRTLATRGHTLRFVASARRTGAYTAIVRDAAGLTSISAPAFIEVQPRIPRSSSVGQPIIVTQPQNVTVQEHATAVFQVSLNNSGPYTSIVWHNDNPLEGPHQIPDGIGLNVHSTRLEIPNCLDADNYNGLYWIAVTNAAGGTVSSKVRLTVVSGR